MGSIVVRKEFAEKNKAALDAFLTEYKASTEFVNANIMRHHRWL
jgi:NitT/TauT family transport system substrate-binding protein